MVKATETTLRSRIGELSPPDQVQTEALRWLRTITESTGLQELATWLKACRHFSNFRNAWETRQGADHFCSRRTDHLQMAEAGHRLSAATLHAAQGAHTNAKKAKEEDQNPRLGQARARLARNASRTRKSTAREPGKGAQQRDHARQRQGKGRKGDAATDSVPVVPDGSVSALTQRLLTRRRDRRQSVSEPPRSKRASETIASLIKANRVAQFVFSLNLGFSAMSQQPFGTVHTNQVFCNHPCAWCAAHEEKPGFFLLCP